MILMLNNFSCNKGKYKLYHLSIHLLEGKAGNDLFISTGNLSVIIVYTDRCPRTKTTFSYISWLHERH